SPSQPGRWGLWEVKPPHNKVEALHVAILRPAEEHIDLSRVKAHLVHGSLVLHEKLVLFVPRGLAEVPRHHHPIRGCGGQQILIHLVPHHVGTAEVQGWFAADTQVEFFHKLVFFDGVDLENVAPGHYHLSSVPAHADGIRRGVQVAAHGPSSDRVATKSGGHPSHFLHGALQIQRFA
uniref:Uncharacterized protein n=1 Tax=Pseudonaja textilis TaxID=8673 RepID=A0A670Y190_PSETE